MTSFILKIIAMVSMLIDHTSIAYLGYTSWMNLIGRIAFPIFAFQISEGYIHTKNLKKYFLRLFLFAVVSQVPFMLFSSIFSASFVLNVFFTLLLGLASIYIYDKSKYKIIGFLFAILIGLIAQFSKCDYGFYGVAIIFIFYIFKNNIFYATTFFVIATLIKYLIQCLENGFYIVYLYLFIFTCFSLFFIILYNGQKGKNTKYLLYLFYPIHLLIIYGIYLLK